MTTTNTTNFLDTARRNRKIMQRLYGQFMESRGFDVDELLDTLLPYATWFHAGTPEPMKGREAIRAYFNELCYSWEQQAYVVESMVAEGSTVAVKAYAHYTHRVNMREFATPVATFWTLTDEGRISDVFEIFDTMALVEATASKVLG